MNGAELQRGSRSLGLAQLCSPPHPFPRDTTVCGARNTEIFFSSDNSVLLILGETDRKSALQLCAGPWSLQRCPHLEQSHFGGCTRALRGLMTAHKVL